MKAKVVILGLILTLVVTGIVFSQQPQLVFPLTEGEVWYITRAYNTPNLPDGSQSSHGPLTNDRYALDFAQAQCGAYGKTVRAAAAGTVDVRPFDEDGYGNYLYIDHGNGYKTLYAHMSEITAQDGAWVEQYDPIGKVGNTGWIVSTQPCPFPGAHLHFRLHYNGVPVKPEPLSGISGFPDGDPENLVYTIPPVNQVVPVLTLSETAAIGEMEGGIAEPISGLSQMFVDAVNAAGITATPFNNGGGAGVHLWGTLYVQDLKNEPNWYVAVYNEHKNEVVVLENEWRFHWLSNSGYLIGPPIELKPSEVYVFGDGKDKDNTVVLTVGETIEAYSFGDPDGSRKTLIKKTDDTIHQVPVGLFNFEEGAPGEEWFIWDDLNGNGGFFTNPPLVDEAEFFPVFTVESDGTAQRYYQPNEQGESYYFANVVNAQIPTGKASYHTVREGNNQTMSLDPNTVQPPIDIVLTIVSGTQIDVSADDPNNPTGTTYEVDVDFGARVEATVSFPYSLIGLTSGSTYTIRLRSLYNGGYSVYSSPHTVTLSASPPTGGSGITITNPTGGESFDAGGTVVVTWTAEQPMDRADVLISTDNGATWPTQYMNLTLAGNYSYSAVLPAVATSQGIIWVRNSDDQTNFAFSNAFSIQDPNAAPVASDFQTATNYPDTVIVSLDGYLTDPDGSINWNTLEVIGVSGGTASIDITNHTITFVPAYGVFGSAPINYHARDNEGAYSNTGTITVDVQVVTSALVNGDFEDDLNGWNVYETKNPPTADVKNTYI